MIYRLGSIHSSLATLNTYLHVRLWLLWCTMDFMPVAILPVYWGLIYGGMTVTEAT